MRPLGCEARHVRSNCPQLLAAMEHVVCFGCHAAREQFAEGLVVLSEHLVKEREEIQCVGVVGQDVQGAREEEEACDVLAQGVEASQDHITHHRQRGNQRQHFGCKSSDGAFGLSAILCSNLNEDTLRLLLGITTLCTKAVTSAKVTPICTRTRTN